MRIRYVQADDKAKSAVWHIRDYHRSPILLGYVGVGVGGWTAQLASDPARKMSANWPDRSSAARWIATSSQCLGRAAA